MLRRVFRILVAVLLIVAIAAVSESLIGRIHAAFVARHLLLISVVTRTLLSLALWAWISYGTKRGTWEPIDRGALTQYFDLRQRDRPEAFLEQLRASLSELRSPALAVQNFEIPKTPRPTLLPPPSDIEPHSSDEIPSAITLDSTHFSITAPASMPIDSICEVTFWAYREEQRETVLRRAKQRLGLRDDFDVLFKSEGPFDLARGSVLSVSLSIKGLVMLTNHRTVRWTGEIGSSTFTMRVPGHAKEGAHAGLARIRVNGGEIIKMHFVLNVGPRGTAVDAVEIPADTRRHKRAFASYASRDRDLVLRVVQGMETAYPGLHVFVDVADLRAGQHFKERIQTAIADADVFYLFWCRHARKSTWVKKEWRWAVEKHGLDFINPVPLEEPRFAPPPRLLAKSMHFNDPWLDRIVDPRHGESSASGASA